MDLPAPNILGKTPEKPNQNEIINIDEIQNDNIKLYTFERDDVKYTINIKIIEINLKIVVTSISNDKIEEKNYEASFTLENLKKNNKIFGLFDTLEEVLENLISIMNQKNFSIVLLNEKELNLILTQKVLMKNEQIVFKLFNKEQTNDELLYEINLLKEENRILKERLDKVEKTMSDIEKKKSMRGLKTIDEIIDEQILFPSKIITKEDEKILILRKFDSRNKKVGKIDLLFRASSNGDKLEDIKKAVNKKKNVFAVLETTKGRKFAGFTEKGYDFSKSLGDDENAFLISFDHYRCYDYEKYVLDFNEGLRFTHIDRNLYSAIVNRNSVPFYFQYNANIGILNNFFSKDSKIENVMFDKWNKIRELNFNEEYFNIKNLEYFQIHFRD